MYVVTSLADVGVECIRGRVEGGTVSVAAAVGRYRIPSDPYPLSLYIGECTTCMSVWLDVCLDGLIYIFKFLECSTFACFITRQHYTSFFCYSLTYFYYRSPYIVHNSWLIFYKITNVHYTYISCCNMYLNISTTNWYSNLFGKQYANLFNFECKIGLDGK